MSESVWELQISSSPSLPSLLPSLLLLSLPPPSRTVYPSTKSLRPRSLNFGGLKSRCFAQNVLRLLSTCSCTPCNLGILVVPVVAFTDAQISKVGFVLVQLDIETHRLIKLGDVLEKVILDRDVRLEQTCFASVTGDSSALLEARSSRSCMGMDRGLRRRQRSFQSGEYGCTSLEKPLRA